jgi:hypothetical protein
MCWTYEWPTNPGFYWFYGYPSEFSTDQELLLVQVFKGADNKLVFISGARFLFEGAIDADAQWQMAILPKLPENPQ